jgi:hypothetical protein
LTVVGAQSPAAGVTMGVRAADARNPTILATIANARGGTATVAILSVHLRKQGSTHPGDEFWAPIDVATGRPLPLERSRRTWRLEPGQTVGHRLDLSRLKWNQSIGALWPDWPLREVVPSGRYRAWVEIHLLSGSEGTEVRSPELDLELR